MSDNRGVVPRKAIIGAGLVLAITMAFAAYGSITGLNLPGKPDSEPTTSVEIRVEDRSDGSVAVYNANSGALIETVAPGENGFIRGAMRALARQRQMQDIGARPPFKLTLWENGRLSLKDTATGERLFLEAYGKTNRDAFAELLVAATKQRRE
jgi:putative photosynthetic complex assembly protein